MLIAGQQPRLSVCRFRCAPWLEPWWAQAKQGGRNQKSGGWGPTSSGKMLDAQVLIKTEKAQGCAHRVN